VAASFPELKVQSPKIAPQVDWVKKWKKYYKPVKIRPNLHSPALWILPAWIKRKVPLKIKINPGQAFGTGTHATTQLCLDLFLSTKTKFKRVLDFGAGTGILAMAAVKRDGANAHCIEIDPTARIQLKKNLKLNHVNAKIINKPQGQYDLIFANVLAPVLLEHKKTLLSALKPGGVLILSGLLRREPHQFLKEFLPKKRRQLALKTQGDWAAVLIESPTLKNKKSS
jgi:ribosomal protein L11 methyltransferase